MEKIGNQKIWSYFDGDSKPRAASNTSIRGGSGHPVSSYFELARKVAELQFLNREHVLLFRGQDQDHTTKAGSSLMKASLFRLEGKKLPTPEVFASRFRLLREAEAGLVSSYGAERFDGLDRLQRHRALRWAILQHYEVCRTPLLDVTQSLRIAASFPRRGNEKLEAFLFVFGVPNLSGAVTASSESGLQIIRLSSACPPEAVRPHIQEGYLLGEYPEIADFDQNAQYEYHEMDFARRLVAKFRFVPGRIWSRSFRPAPVDALYPKKHRDRLRVLTDDLKASLGNLRD